MIILRLDFFLFNNFSKFLEITHEIIKSLFKIYIDKNLPILEQ